MQDREHRRVRMRLPARFRWTTPLGQKIELCETIDVSRGGLLLSSKEPHTAGVPLWVTFPYDALLPDGQPEVLARVVRCGEMLQTIRAANIREKSQTQIASDHERSAKLDRLAHAIGISDAKATFAVAIHFEEQAHTDSNGNRARYDPERRASIRHALAVPVRVRPEKIPWFEEAMTLDFSLKGMRFRSRREYQTGDALKIALENATSTPWSSAGEFHTQVVRVSPAPDAVSLDVSVCRA
jgi:hypothetical protein